MFKSIKKFTRYISLYGVSRSFVKACGKMRLNFPFWILSIFSVNFNKKVSVGLIGCGQFCYSTISYYLTFCNYTKFEWCMDTNIKAASSLAKSYKIKQYSDKNNYYNFKSDLVYISSYHSTHADYAIKHLENGSDVYVEKPLCTNWNQLSDIKKCLQKTKKKIYVGYNRPFAPLVIKLKKEIICNIPFTLSFFITGHFIDNDHWYRNTDEGTRICGNLGHWLDLTIHLLKLRNPSLSRLEINISYSDMKMTSENISITIVSPENDRVVITFSPRGEPFEGVNESINFQQGDLIAKIDDHKEMKVWRNQDFFHYKNRLKDVGHKSAILQPFQNKNTRDWEEVIVSTRLILTVTDMVNNKLKFKDFMVEDL